MSRRKSTTKAPTQAGFGRLLQITILLSIVFSAGLITGQRLLHHASMPPLVSVQGPALSVAAQRHLAKAETQAGDNENDDATAKTRFSFYEKLSKPTSDDGKAPSRRFLTPKPEPEKPAAAAAAVEAAHAQKPEAPAVAVAPAEPARHVAIEKPLDAVALAQAADPAKKQLPTLSANAASVQVDDSAVAARYTLQIGAYPSYERARQEMLRLEKIGLEPHVIAADVPGQGKFYRVRVGKFHSMDEARTFQADTREKNNLETFVTPL